MVKKTMKLLCASFCLSSLLSFGSTTMVAGNIQEIHTGVFYGVRDSIVGSSALLADKVEIRSKLANEKKMRDNALKKTLEEEALRYPAIDLYGEDSWNQELNPVAGKGAVIPAQYDINLSKFEMPLDETHITSHFGYRRRFHRMHFGTDLALHVGDTVRSAFPGRVRVVGYNRGGYGNYIIVRHPNGLETLYGHLHRPICHEGEIVQAGQAIGLGGSTGRSTGPHLHFEMRFMGIALDPQTLIDFNDGVPKMQEFAFTRNSITSAIGSRTVFSRTGVPASSLRYTYRRSRRNRYAQISTHRIKKGESLYTIAHKYGTSISKLRKLNGISKSYILRPGSSLRVK